MRKLPFLLVSLFFCAVLPATAQKSPVKFGDIPMDDMKMTSYAADTTAAAVVLSDYGYAYIDPRPGNVVMVFERHTRIKILKKEGLSWADVSIPLYNGGSAEETVSNLKAATYNLEGGKIVETKLDKEGVFKEKFSKYMKVQKFTMPNVKEGSVIDYSYKINSEFFTNFPNWKFQRTIPTRKSEFWAAIPEFFTYVKYMQGYVPVTNYETKDLAAANYNTKLHHWTSDNVPAFKEEPFMTSEDDFVSRINFALSYISFPGQPTQEVMGTWGKLTNGLMESESFGKAIKGNNFLKKTVEELTAGKVDQMEIVKIIHTYVKENITWDGDKDFLLGNAKKILEEKKGTSGDINIILASMLEKAGIDVQMVLCSTRDHGFIRQEYPMSRQFNYVVCLATVGDKKIWLDATEKLLPINVLPQRCLNGEGLLVTKEGAEKWITLDSKTKAKTAVSADLTIEADGMIQGKLNYTHDGYNAQAMRKSYLQKDNEEEYLKEFLGTRNWKISKRDFQNIKDISTPAKELYELSVEDHANAAGDMIYVNPFVCNRLESNPFSTESRVYPVNFGSNKEDIYILKLTIPEGYKVEELPQNKMLALPGNAARYVYSVNNTGNLITITSMLSINKNMFTQDEYPNLRELYSLVIAKQAEQIVLKKK